MKKLLPLLTLFICSFANASTDYTEGFEILAATSGNNFYQRNGSTIFEIVFDDSAVPPGAALGLLSIQVVSGSSWLPVYNLRSSKKGSPRTEAVDDGSRLMLIAERDRPHSIDSLISNVTSCAPLTVHMEFQVNDESGRILKKDYRIDQSNGDCLHYLNFIY